MQVQDIQNNIMLKLQEIENENGIKIILAVESGSRAWEMASNDSDFDVRFVYVRPDKDYLRLNNIKDMIDWQLDEVYDINGWDLKKFLQHLYKSNAVVFEWLSSNIIYLESDFAQNLRRTSKDYFQAKNCVYHYWHLADKMFKIIKDEPKVRLKQYLYIIRPIMAAKWILNKNDIPPIELPILLDAITDSKVSNLVARLLQEKLHSNEKDVTLHNEVLDEYIINSLKFIKAKADVMKKENPNWDALNLLFYNAVYDFYPPTNAIR